MTPENTENDCLFMTLSRKIRSKKYDDNFDGSVHCMLCADSFISDRIFIISFYTSYSFYWSGPKK